MGTLAIRAKHGRRWAGLARTAGALALGAALCACHTPKGSEWLPYGREIEALNRHMEEQFRTGNLLGVADMYADDAMLLDERGTRVAGRQEIDEYWSGIEDPVDWKLEIRSIYGSDS